jgi:hypothetical protein
MKMGKKINILFVSAFLGCPLGCSVAKGTEDLRDPVDFRGDVARDLVDLTDDEMALIRAILSDDLGSARFYIEAGFGFNTIVNPSKNMTLLMWLIARCPRVLTQEVLRLLELDQNFDPNFRNNDGNTAAHMCVENGIPLVLNVLLDLPNFDPNTKGSHGTILHSISMRSIFLFNFGPWGAIIEKILRHPTWDSEVRDNEERTVMDLLAIQKASHSVIDSVDNINFIVSNLLFGSGVVVPRQNVNILLQKITEAKAGRLSPSPEMQLRDVIMGGNAGEIRTWLVENPFINVNWQDPTNHGRTLLMYAIATGDYEVVQIILDLPGVDPTLTDSDGHTALSYAMANRNLDIIGLLQPQEDLPAETEQ